MQDVLLCFNLLCGGLVVSVTATVVLKTWAKYARICVDTGSGRGFWGILCKNVEDGVSDWYSGILLREQNRGTILASLTGSLLLAQW